MHCLRRHLLTLASALALLLSAGVFALWLVWLTLFVRHRTTLAGGGVTLAR